MFIVCEPKQKKQRLTDLVENSDKWIELRQIVSTNDKIHHTSLTIIMGNCFKSSNNDDISLLRGHDNNEPSPDQPPFVDPPPPYRAHAQPEPQRRMPIYHPSPGVSRPANQLSEDEQIKIAQRLGLINHLPTGKYDGTNKKAKECVICMNEFTLGEPLRYLPCMHTYHKECIDDWLMRSFTCPSCMEPVDAALLTTYQTS